MNRNLLDNITKLLKAHLLVTNRILLKNLNQKGSVEGLLNFPHLKILTKHHELVDRHDCSLVFDLLKSRVITRRIAGLTVMLKDDPQVVLVLPG